MDSLRADEVSFEACNVDLSSLNIPGYPGFLTDPEDFDLPTTAKADRETYRDYNVNDLFTKDVFDIPEIDENNLLGELGFHDALVDDADEDDDYD